MRRLAFALGGWVSTEGSRCLGSTATKLSRLDASEDGKVVRWCRMQASSHNSQGVVDGRVNEVCVITAALDRSAVLCG